MEASPIDTSIVSFEDIFDDSIGVAEKISLTAVCTLHLIFERHGLSGSHLFAKACKVRAISDASTTFALQVFEGRTYLRCPIRGR